MQSTVINSYLSQSVYYLHYFSLLFIIFYYFPLFSLSSLLLSFCCKKWYTFSCDTALMQWSVWFIFSHFDIWLYCVVSFLWGPQTVWFVILHLECSTQNFWGGGVSVTQWYLGCLKSPLFTRNTFDYNVNNSYLYLFKPFIIFL